MYHKRNGEWIMYLSEGGCKVITFRLLEVKLGQADPFESTATPYKVQIPFLKLMQSLCNKTINLEYKEDFIRHLFKCLLF